MLRLRTFGGLSVENAVFVGGAAARRRPLALLAVLAVGGRRGLSRDKIVALLWPESDEERARNSLSQAMSSLRRELGTDDILMGTAEIRLNPEVITSDVEQFERALAAGELERAVELQEGPFLDGVFIKDAAEFEEWTARERARLQHLQVDALERLAIAASERKDHHAAVGLWRRLAALESTNARTALGLMEALAACGDRASALDHFQLYQKLLREEYACGPEPAVEAFAARLRDTPNAATRPPTGGEAAPNDQAAHVLEVAEPAVAPPSTHLRRSRRHYVLLSLGAVAVVTAVTLGISKARESASIDRKRVLVAPFDNLTGDSSLAPLSHIVADWVTDGLARTGLVRVVDPGTTVAAARNVEASKATGPARLRALGEEAGAGLLVAGAYHAAGDSLCIQSRIVDSRTDEILRTMDAVCGPSRAPMAAVERLRTRVMGGLASIIDARLASVSGTGSPPPNYEAYRAYMEGLEQFSRVRYAAAIPHFERAARNDSTFVLPLIWMSHAYSNSGNASRRDSLLKTLAVSRDKLAPAERHGLDALLARRRNDEDGELTALREAAALAPQSNWAFMLGSRFNGLDRPREAIEVLRRIDPHRGWVRGWSGYWLALTTAYHLVGDYRAEVDVIHEAMSRLPDNAWLKGYELKAFAALGSVRDVDRIVNNIVAAPVDTMAPGPVEFMQAAALEYLAHGHAEAGRLIADRCSRWPGYTAYGASISRMTTRVACFYLAGRAAEAESLYREIAVHAASSPVESDRSHRNTAFARLAILAARRGDRAEALRLSAIVDTIPQYDGPRRVFVAQAQIAAALGDRDRAVSLVKRGIGGSTPPRWAFQHGIDYAPLRGYGPFKEITRPNEGRRLRWLAGLQRR